MEVRPLFSKEINSLSNMLSLLVGELFAHVRKKLPWADPKVVKVIADVSYALFWDRWLGYYELQYKIAAYEDYLLSQEVIDAELYKLLGERTAADNEKPVKKKKEKPVKVEVVLLHLMCFILLLTTCFGGPSSSDMFCPKLS